MLTKQSPKVVVCGMLFNFGFFNFWSIRVARLFASDIFKNRTPSCSEDTNHILYYKNHITNQCKTDEKLPET